MVSVIIGRWDILQGIHRGTDNLEVVAEDLFPLNLTEAYISISPAPTSLMHALSWVHTLSMCYAFKALKKQQDINQNRTGEAKIWLKDKAFPAFCCTK